MPNAGHSLSSLLHIHICMSRAHVVLDLLYNSAAGIGWRRCTCPVLPLSFWHELPFRDVTGRSAIRKPSTGAAIAGVDGLFVSCDTSCRPSLYNGPSWQEIVFRGILVVV